jgi:succinyl-diaminopimelate desuccinylase
MLTREVLADPVALTRALVDIESVSGNEAEIADCVEAALGGTGLKIERFGHTIVARSELDRPERVVLAGHLDTVPLHDNFPSRTEDGLMWGCGTSDMKAGTAIALHLAVTEAEPRHDVTYVFYDCEEVDSARNGLKILADTRPHLLTDASFAVLLEPTHGLIEAGCQGTQRVLVRTGGKRAHSARSWLGENAIHKAAPILERLQRYRERTVTIDACEYHEGLNAVRIAGGVAGNVIPDECVVEVNFRFAPDRSEADAEAFVRDFFDGYDVTVTDSAPGALPGLDVPAAKAFVDAVGGEVNPKFGWTDVARFTGLGVPAVNFGPGDPMLAHKQEEHVPVEQIERCETQLRAWLAS